MGVVLLVSATRDWIGSGIKALSTDCCAVPQEHEALLEERRMSTKNGSRVRLVGEVPPYQLWVQADIEAGARKAATRMALKPRPAPSPLPEATQVAVTQVGTSLGHCNLSAVK